MKLLAEICICNNFLGYLVVVCVSFLKSSILLFIIYESDFKFAFYTESICAGRPLTAIDEHKALKQVIKSYKILNLKN